MVEVEIDKDVYLPCYHHLLEENDIDIELLWGGRDSGKSKFVAQYFLEQSMMLDYFRCILVKQTHESIKDAQWQMIKDTAEQWDVDHLFKFTESPLSIRCSNGNTFATRGMDNPGKVKSFSNPSHVWIEEADQISKDSFTTLLTGLRSDYGKVKLFMSFNPETSTPAYEDFWLYKMFFEGHENELSFTGTTETKIVIDGEEKVVSLKYRSTHVTYHDNPYVSYQRIGFHESLAITNPYQHKVFTQGLWGNKLNESPYAYAFNRDKHVSNGISIPHPVLKRSEPVILAWDFNRNPMTCDVIQNYDQKVRVLEVIRIPNSGVDAMCEQILAKYPGCVFLVTGDYNGDNTSSLYEEQVTHYLLIQKYLGLSDGQIKIRPNPKQAKNSTHINTILSYYDVIIHGVNARPLIFDLENVKRRADGTILKTDRDKADQQADALDGFRYFCNEFLDGYAPTEEQILAKAAEAGLKESSSTGVIDKIKQALEGSGFEVFTDTNQNVGFKAIASIEAGSRVICTRKDYHNSVRNAILEQAGKWVDAGDGVRATAALGEVKRLDLLFLK